MQEDRQYKKISKASAQRDRALNQTATNTNEHDDDDENYAGENTNPNADDNADDIYTRETRQLAKCRQTRPRTYIIYVYLYLYLYVYSYLNST